MEVLIVLLCISGGLWFWLFMYISVMSEQARELDFKNYRLRDACLSGLNEMISESYRAKSGFVDIYMVHELVKKIRAI